MGLWKLLTKPLSLSSAKLAWNEPLFFRPRLRGDLWLRLLIILGAWLAVSGALLIVFASNANPPARSVAFGLGLIGAGVAYLCILARRSQISGTCRLYATKLVWDSATGAGLGGQTAISITWEYGVIETCRIVSAEQLGQSFSALILAANDDDVMLIGIPGSVELREVAKVLKSGGVNVCSAKAVPARLTRPLPPAAGVGVAIAGLALLLAGFTLGGTDERNPQRPQIAIPGHEPVDVAPGFPLQSESSPANAAATGDTKQSGTAPALSEISGGAAFPGGAPAGLPGLSSGRPAGLPDRPTGEQSPANGAIAGFPATASAALRESDSELIGGPGGFPFRAENADGKAAVAVEYSLGTWSGRERVGRLVPRSDRTAVAPQAKAVVAPKGYAVGAMEIHADALVNAIRFVFMRQKADGSLDPQDWQHSEWIGQPLADAEPRVVSGRGRPAIGFVGRGGAVLDAVGLSFATAPAE
jgi:hypothetical protein